MKFKHILALLSLTTCFACSTGSVVNNETSKMSSQENGITYLTVTFDLNGGKYNDSDTFKLDKVLPTTYWQHLADKAPGSTSMPITYPNHNFKGYSFSKEDTNLIPKNYVVEDSITVYAQYDNVVEKECTVNWKDDSTTLLTEKYVPGDTPTFKGDLPIHEGYVFDSWNPAPSVITESDVGTTIDYVAKYVPSERYYTVTLDYNNGGENLNYQYIVENKKAEQPIITYTGHHLTNWTYVEGGSDVFTFDTLITHDIKIKANWEVDEYTITYIPNGGTITSSINKATYNGTIATAPVMTRDGYDVNQVTWWTDQACTTSRFNFGAVGTGTPVTGPTTLYAKWGSIQSIDITFDANGGYFDTTAETSKVVSTTYGQIPVAPTPKRDVTSEYTYSFKGWDKTLEPAKPASEGGTVLYKAQWNPTKNSYHVTFDANGGSITSEVSSLDVTYGETIAVADRPTVARDGYTATTDWYDAPTGGTQFVFGTSTVTKNMTLYARWGSIKTYTVHFFDDSATPVEYTDLKETGIEYNQRAWRPVTDPSKTEYTFDGWYTTKDHTTAFDFSVPLTGSDADVNVYAKFSEKQYRVRWLNADIDHTPLVNAEYYSKDEVPTYKGDTPSLEPDINHRYKFKGFSPEIVPVDDNMTYYATYDYDDEINFHYFSLSIPVAGKVEFTTVETYGGLIILEFESDKMMRSAYESATFTIDGTSYTAPELEGDVYPGTDGGDDNLMYFNVSYSAKMLRNAKSIDMEVLL